MSSAPPARVMLVDDHPIVRKGLRALLEAESDLEVSAEADGPEAAMALLEKELPDILITDISLDSGDGLELVRRIRARWTVPILVLSIHDETLYAERALRAGASGYMMKQEATSDVVRAIRKVLAGETWLSERLAARPVKPHPPRGPGVSPNDSPLASLSDRELQVFHLISQGFGTGEISRSLNISRKTVETHRAHIKDKMGLRSGVELVQFAARFKSNLKDGG